MIKNFESLRNPSLADFRILAIHEIDPDAGFSIVDGAMSWDKTNANAKPSDEDIEKKALELQTLHKDLEYAKHRKEEYPDWGEQLNKIYDDGITKWKSEMVDPVKAKWPKDNSGPK